MVLYWCMLHTLYMCRVLTYTWALGALINYTVEYCTFALCANIWRQFYKVWVSVCPIFTFFVQYHTMRVLLARLIQFILQYYPLVHLRGHMAWKILNSNSMVFISFGNILRLDMSSVASNFVTDHVFSATLLYLLRSLTREHYRYLHRLSSPLWRSSRKPQNSTNLRRRRA